MKSKAVILLFAFTALVIVFTRENYKGHFFEYDKSGYYLYLPAIFIYHDLGSLGFYPSINRRYKCTGSNDSLSIFRQKANKRLNKYPVGTAIFELPLFLTANLYCTATHQYEPDGYTAPYKLTCMLSTILWVIAGLFVLRKFLKNYFADNITAFAILCVAFGTNIYNYTAFDQGMSHVYSFFLVSCLLLVSDNLYRQNNPKYFYYAGLILGLIVITRPVNIIAAIIPAFWGVHNSTTFKNRIRFFAIHYKKILISMAVFLIVAFIQFAYWKHVTGNWLVYSYKGERFHFLHPKILKGLFSYQKGWFVYSPIAFIGMLGFYSLWKKQPGLVPTLAIFFLMMFYVVFSWYWWSYGGSFGCRPLIETLPAVTLLLAALLEAVFSKKNHYVIKSAGSILLCFLIALNLFQTYQFSVNIIDCDRMTRRSYWYVFGKLKINYEEEDGYLIDGKEYYRIDPD